MAFRYKFNLPVQPPEAGPTLFGSQSGVPSQIGGSILGQTSGMTPPNVSEAALTNLRPGLAAYPNMFSIQSPQQGIPTRPNTSKVGRAPISPNLMYGSGVGGNPMGYGRSGGFYRGY